MEESQWFVYKGIYWKWTNSTEKGSRGEGEESLSKPKSRHIYPGWVKDRTGVCSGFQPNDDDDIPSMRHLADMQQIMLRWSPFLPLHKTPVTISWICKQLLLTIITNRNNFPNMKWDKCNYNNRMNFHNKQNTCKWLAIIAGDKSSQQIKHLQWLLFRQI